MGLAAPPHVGLESRTTDAALCSKVYFSDQREKMKTGCSNWVQLKALYRDVLACVVQLAAASFKTEPPP